MEKRVSKILSIISPLLVLYIINFYTSKCGENIQGKFILKTVLITIGYFCVYFIIHTKNKYLNLDNLHRFRYLLLVIVFAFLVIFKIHGSSISIWDNYYRDYGEGQTASRTIGVPRAVRSDEWLVQTPLYLAQVSGEGNLDRVNENIRSDGEDIVISSYGPALDITNIGKPFNWGFLFLGAERGFSWYWNLKLLSLFILSYEMALILSKKNKFVALFGAMLITFAPASQWWFSSLLVDLIIYSQALVVSVYYYLNSEQRWIKSISTALFIIAGIGFVISLYPPIQVSLGYLTLIFLVYIVLKNRKNIKKNDIVTFILSTVFILGVVGYFVYTAKDAINLLMGTVYPGARVELGGSKDFLSTCNYLFGWMLPYKDSEFLNNSELSGYISLLPLIIILFFRRNKDEDNKLMVAIFVYILIMCSFLMFTYPEFLAKITLFSYIPQQRMAVTLGLAGTYFICMLLPQLIEKKEKITISLVITIASLILLFIPIYFGAMNEYLGKKGIVTAILAFGILIYFLVRGHVKEIVPYTVCFMLITGLLVNPISRGLGSIYRKEVSRAITQINSEAPGKWVGIDNLVVGDFLNANGVKTLNSTHFYPDLDTWKLIDPNGKYEDVYNRFSHVIVDVTNGEDTFELTQADVFTAIINVKDFKTLGVDYVISNKDLEEFNNGELEQIYFNQVDNTYIYKCVGDK